MIHNYLSQYPVAYFLLFIAGMVAMICFAVWVRKFKYDSDANNTEHHWWGMCTCMFGCLVLASLLLMGFADNPVQALGDAGEEVVDVIEELVE
jgi:uncharacterized membrane protein YdcZ (DUF606 family)